MADAAAAVLDLGERLGGTHVLCHPGTSWKVLIDPTDQAPLRCGWLWVARCPTLRRGRYRATFTDATIESNWTAGYDGRATTTLIEYTEQGQRQIDLPARDAYAAVIDHVLAFCQGRDSSRLSPASVLDALQFTLEVRAALTAAKRP